jgi:hypothetical protein
MPVSQRVQMNFIFNDNVRILCLSYNVKKVGKPVRFKQKGQKQASFWYLRFMDCHYHFGILDLWIVITTLVSSNIS